MIIELRKWTKDDKVALANICNNADRRYLRNRIPYPYTDADAEWWLNMVQEQEGKNGVYRAIVVDEKYVGNISIEQKDDVYCKDAEIGYMLLGSEWSKGIMTAAVSNICELAFNNLDIIRITGLVHEPNIGSRRVLEKNNFILEGIMKKAIYKNDNIYDECIYGLLK
ncbi:GNAT family N-acetyltransferase [Clostridium paraputrificum]|uniref:GNAT family N-acetyltransferase n=1 Tax=Clostridium paraputrificum TaxID=29363 RepID=UPI003D342CBA